MKRFTIKDVQALNPCEDYTPERLEELFVGRDTLTLADVVDMPEVSPADVVWLASNIFTPRQRVIFGCKRAEDAGMSAWAAWAAGAAARAAAGERQLLFIAETILETENAE